MDTEREDVTTCRWCKTEFRQTGVGRPRIYCRRSCRQRDYEDRREEERLLSDRALNRRLWERLAAQHADTSRDESQPAVDTSRDESKTAGQTPATPQRPAPRTGWQPFAAIRPPVALPAAPPSRRRPQP
jgi:hypothetical protein